MNLVIRIETDLLNSSDAWNTRLLNKFCRRHIKIKDSYKLMLYTVFKEMNIKNIFRQLIYKICAKYSSLQWIICRYRPPNGEITRRCTRAALLELPSRPVVSKNSVTLPITLTLLQATFFFSPDLKEFSNFVERIFPTTKNWRRPWKIGSLPKPPIFLNAGISALGGRYRQMIHYNDYYFA